MPSLLFFLTILIFSTNAQNALILPITKDPKTSQFHTTFQMGTNPSTITAVIDLGGRHLWFACDNYTSETFAKIPCNSAKCDLSGSGGCLNCTGPTRHGCIDDTCVGFASSSPYMDYITTEGYYEDTLSSGDHVRLPEIMFSCVPNDFTAGLATGATGMVGLGINVISLHKQVANKLNLRDSFSICLPSSGLGKLSVGLGGSDMPVLVKYTCFIINPVSTSDSHEIGDPSEDYFIDVKSIRVGGEFLSVSDSYFAIDKNGVGGTKISTVQKYTSLHTSIYKPLTRAFDKAAANMKIKSVAAVAPFRACYSTESISRTRAGTDVPAIDLILPGDDVYWRIYGANSMVEIDQETTCLAFVDGGSRPRTSIVIGVHQLEENFLEFDLVSMQLKFTSSLLVHNRSCSSS